VIGVAYSGDGERVVTASRDETARVWDADTGALVAELRGHDGAVYSAEFSRDGSLVVTAGGDNTARVWDAATGREIQVLSTGAKSGEPTYTFVPHVAASFSSDGSRVIMASYDGRVRLWDLENGQLVARFRSDLGVVNSAAFSPDGTMVLTADDNGTATIWDARDGTQIAVFPVGGEVVMAAFSTGGRRIITIPFGGARLHTCDVCAPVKDLISTAEKRVARAFTPVERAGYLPAE
jgi:WD40 repeat protein